MSKKTKKALKPKSPEQIAAEKALRRSQDFAAVGLAPDAATLAKHADVDIRRANQQQVDTARRLDAFEALKDGMAPGAYDAARRLERDMLIRRGEGDRGRRMARVDSDRATDHTDDAIAAGQRIREALAGVGDRDAFLLTELLDASPAHRLARPTWREVVAYVTGERNEHAQAGVVRNVCANLAAAYDRPARKAA